MRREQNEFDLGRPARQQGHAPTRRVRMLARPAGGMVEERRIAGGTEESVAGDGGATVVICLDGVGTAVVERETFLARAGFIVILRRETVVRFAAGPQGMRWIVVRWPERALAALGPLRQGLDRTRALYGRASVALAWRISDELRMNDPLSPWAVDVMANGIAVGLTRGTRSYPQPSELARRARRAIERAGHRSTSLAAIARDLGCTPEHLSRLFRRSYGMTPSRFAMWRRIEQAKRLLLGGVRPVADIAAELGFSDGSHFGRHFRAWTGMTPARFRELVR